MLDRNEIWAQAAELGQLISESPVVLAYKEAKETMESHPEIKHLLSKLRDMQEQYERLSAYSTGPHLKSLEESMKETIAILDEYPEVQNFRKKTHEVDQLLKAVTDVLSTSVIERVNLE
jgi:cell fate (sporulation/competence/biofilm development) regulator YmcA (YheA/YmcA/DUF963 family)